MVFWFAQLVEIHSAKKMREASKHSFPDMEKSRQLVKLANKGIKLKEKNIYVGC